MDLIEASNGNGGCKVPVGVITGPVKPYNATDCEFPKMVPTE